MLNESHVHTLSIPMGKLICFCKNLQSDMSNSFQKHFIIKGTHSFQEEALSLIFPSEFEGALFTMAGTLCLKEKH